SHAGISFLILLGAVFLPDRSLPRHDARTAVSQVAVVHWPQVLELADFLHSQPAVADAEAVVLGARLGVPAQQTFEVELDRVLLALFFGEELVFQFLFVSLDVISERVPNEAERHLLDAGAPRRALLMALQHVKRYAKHACDLGNLKLARLEKLRVLGRNRERRVDCACRKKTDTMRVVQPSLRLAPLLLDLPPRILGHLRRQLQQAPAPASLSEPRCAELFRHPGQAKRFAMERNSRQADDAVVADRRDVDHILCLDRPGFPVLVYGVVDEPPIIHPRSR